MNSKNNILLIIVFLFCSLPLFANINLSDVNIYSELKSKISDNTNIDNTSYEIFQELSFKLNTDISKKLKIWVAFKSEYVQFHWKSDNRFLYLDSAALEYQITPVFKFIFGSLYVDYSPYIIKGYPWVHNLFRGIGFEYKNYKFEANAFVANNGDNPDETTWNPPVTFDLDYRLIDEGYSSSNVQKTYPSLWAGAKVKYTVSRNLYFTPEIKIVYLRENYTKKDITAKYVDIYDNNIFGIDAKMNVLDYLIFFGSQNIAYNHTDKYTVNANYFGTNKSQFIFLKKEVAQYSAQKARVEIQDILKGLLKQYKTQYFFEYEKVDPQYHPVYVEENLDNRSLNPYDNVYTGREGFWTGVYQTIGFGFVLGAGYQQYTFKKSYYHNFQDGSIFTEKQLVLKNDKLKQFRFYFIYQMRNMLQGTLPEGEKSLNSFYVRIQSDIINNVYMELEYSKNKDYHKNYDEILLKLMAWGW